MRPTQLPPDGEPSPDAAPAPTRVTAESADGRTVFRVRLPAIEQPA